MKRRVYVCDTYHHVLISCLKEADVTNKADIIITAKIPTAKELKFRLQKSLLFNRVIFIEQEPFFLPHNIWHILFYSFFECRFVNKKVGINNYLRNKEIYLYNDWTWFSIYLKAHHRKYHYIEDGVDALALLPEKYFKNLNGRNDFARRLIAIAFPYSYYSIRYYDQCRFIKTIEVNKIEDLKIHNLTKVVVSPKNELFKVMDEGAFKDIIPYIFGISKDKNKVSGNNNAMIFGSCELVDGMVSDKSMWISFYQSVINIVNKRYNVYFKAHPRDNTHYNFINATIIDNHFPSEVIKYSLDNYFKLYIAYSSSSVKMFAKEKVLWSDSMNGLLGLLEKII